MGRFSSPLDRARHRLLAWHSTPLWVLALERVMAPSAAGASRPDRRYPVDPGSGADHAGRMHAVVATVRLEDPQAAREALAGMRLNLVPRAPGFVSAYWLAPVDGIGMSVIVFDTKEHADEAVAYPLPPLPGVTPLTVQVREVYASA